jgi:alkylation response protein AidB-like acyl-CoA dehydrogenase
VTDLGESELERELRDSVRGMLAAHCPPAEVLAWCEGTEPYHQGLWRRLAREMGLAGLLVPESYGGAGASLREVAVVLEELGRAVAPVPYLSSAVVATTALLAAGGDPLLAVLASGEATAALAVPFGAACEPNRSHGGAACEPNRSHGGAAPSGVAGPAVRVSDGALTGEVRAVADALGAETLLVPTDAGLYAVPGDGAGVLRRPVVSLDLTRPLCDLTLDRAPGQRLGDGPGAVAAALRVGAALLASEQVGVADWCLDSTVDYLKNRYQFGRPVGSYQAVKHRLADVWVELTQARAVARYAAACAAAIPAASPPSATLASRSDASPLDRSDARDSDLPVAAALAQAYCAPMAVHAAEECVQLHGGIGFTWEHPAHLYLKRAKSTAIAFGTADRHRAALAQLVDLPAPTASS